MRADEIQNPLQHANDVLGVLSVRNDGYRHHQLQVALMALVQACELPDGWKNEYSKRDPETEIELYVYNPNGMNWFWSAFDPDTEDHCVSTLPGFETKEAAMKAAEEWYKDEWLPKFRATGERDF